MPVAANVRIDKPLSTGAILVAPLGTPVPTDASTAPDAAFKVAGYLMQGGVTNHNDRTSNNVVADGGDIVRVASSDDTDSYEFTLIETNQVSVGMFRGQANVTAVGGVLTVRHNAEDLDHYALLIERIDNGKKRRIVAEDAQVTSRGDVQYQDSDASAMPVTMTCFPDENGDKSIEYIELADASGAGGV